MAANRKMTDNRRSPSQANNTAETVLTALAAHPGASAGDLADAAGIGRSTATKALATLAAAGRVTREPGGRDGGRRLADRWALAKATKAKGAPASRSGTRPATSPGERLGKGQLAAMVLDYLRTNPGEHSPSAVAKGLGGKSSGAVANALDKFVASGDVTEVCPSPRRYQAVASCTA